MTSVILAGGLGTRLRPILPNRPKVLAEVSGRPFLSYIFEQLISAGVRKVVLCTGHRAQMILELFGSTYKSLDLKYSTEDRPLGTAGALRLALPYLSSEYVLVMNGDSFINVKFAGYIDWFVKNKCSASMLLAFVSDTRRFGKVLVDESGRVISFKEKGSDSSSGWINAGAYLIKKSLIETIPEETPFSLERDFFPKLVEQGLCGFKFEGDFIDIGTPKTFALAEDFFLSI